MVVYNSHKDSRDKLGNHSHLCSQSKHLSSSEKFFFSGLHVT